MSTNCSEVYESKLSVPLRVVLAGNPNSGKTSLFNALTGARQRVGNYPGVTVEKRQGVFVEQGLRVELLDLPGTYSLSSFSLEEQIAQQELLRGEAEGGPDVIVAVVDSTALSRSLGLLAQLMELGRPLVLCLNMADEADRAGQRVDIARLRRLLGFPVVQTVAHRGIGEHELKDALRTWRVRELTGKRAPAPVSVGPTLDAALEAINEVLRARGVEAAGRWVATRLLVDDDSVVARVSAAGGEEAVMVAAEARACFESEQEVDITLALMQGYGAFVQRLLDDVVTQPARPDARAFSDRVDSLVAHRLLGIPIFLAAMYGVFYAAFSLGEAPMHWIETGFAALGAAVSGLWPAASPSPLRSLLVDGVIGGVGGVVIFLPNIVLLFFCLTLLEDTGYMARAAFLVDRWMHRFGLHGRSFVPMMTGFGCSIPGIMATRTLDNERDRLATMLVLPLMSCGARLPIWMLLIPAFFPAPYRAPMLWAIYFIGIALALLLVLLLRKSLFRGEDAPFVMELPPYRLPTPRALLLKLVERSWLYLRKAGTVILGISIVMWFITAYPKAGHYEVDAARDAGKLVVAAAASAEAKEARRRGATVISATRAEELRAGEDLRASAAGRIGRVLEPLFAPLGFDWKISTALIGAFAAKEVFVAQMAIVNSLGGAGGATEIQAALRRDYSPLTGLSLMLFLLIATPCMATFAVTRRESGSMRWALVQFGGLTFVAYLISLLVYQLGRLFFF